MSKKSMGGVWSKARAAFGNRTKAMNATEERDFVAGERVRSLGPVKNDGTYAHKSIGEIVVHERDLGIVHEKWTFLGQLYYTVEFIDRAVVVIMRGGELSKAD